MIFLLSMVLALLFVLFLGKSVRTHPIPFYLAAAGIAAAVAVLTWCGVRFPAGFTQWIWPIFARGGLAGGLFVLVMLTGAFPNGSAPMKQLMPIRGQLSILASILTLGHNAAYGKVYFVQLFTNPSRLPGNQLLAAVCSVLMLVIMLPLFITSFPAVRRQMKAKNWKKLQRFAYAFYALLYCHILLLAVPSALRGSRAYQLTVFVYSAIFLSYGVCRVLKAAAGRQPCLAKRQLRSAACCCAAACVFALCLTPWNSATQGDPAPQSLSYGGEAAPQNISYNGEIVDVPGEAAGSGHYQDGVFTGSAMGMNAQITVSVTIQDDIITDIVIDSQREDEPYFTDALDIIDWILQANSTDVDTVTGATYSSGGILDAVDNALEQAAA